MIGEEHISRKPIALIDVKEILKERKKEKDLTYEQEQAVKYANAFAKLTSKQSEKLFKELMDLETINEKLAIKICDLLPAELETMKLVPDKNEGVSEEDLKKAFELVSALKKK